MTYKNEVLNGDSMGWYNYNPKDVVRVYEDKDFIVDYNTSGKMYRVSVFEDDHFKDEFWFDAYEKKEVDNRIEKIIDKLGKLQFRFKIKMTKQRLYLNANGVEHLFDLLIDWIKGL